LLGLPINIVHDAALAERCIASEAVKRIQEHILADRAHDIIRLLDFLIALSQTWRNEMAVGVPKHESVGLDVIVELLRRCEERFFWSPRRSLDLKDLFVDLLTNDLLFLL
jgi:hypothetical protein